MYPKINIDGKEIKIFTDVVIEQNFNAHHKFSFRVLDENLDHGLQFMKKGAFEYIGKEITIKWATKKNTPVTFKGIVTEINASSGHKDAADLEIAGYSSSYVFSNLPKSRTFFDKNVKNTKQNLENIVNEASKDVGKSFCKISTTIANKIKIPYAVQYQENVFDFLNRLAISYGEWFYVNEDTLYFGNPNPSNPKVHELTLGVNLFSINYELGVQPVRTNVSGYNHHTSEKYVLNSAAKSISAILDKLNSIQKNIFGSQEYEQLLWEPNSTDETQKQAEYRYQHSLSRSFSFRGKSDKSDIKLGDILQFKIENPLNNNTQESLNECRVVSIKHNLEGSQSEGYNNTFIAIDKKIEYIPVYAEKIPEKYDAQPEYAEVISTEDAHGRVQVAFFWNKDRELNKSFFIPCLSPYSGSNKKHKGFLFIPEIGDIVLIGYHMNNPNHPYVMGGLYNSKTVNLSNDNKKNEIKSITTASGHVIEFNDKKDAESITITDKDQNIILMNKDGVKIKDHNKNEIELRKEGISIVDGDNKNSIITSSSGIEIKAEKDVIITAKNIKLKAETELEQKAGSAEVKIGSEIEHKVGSSSIKLSSAEIEQKSGAGTVKVGAAGVDVKGPMIKLG